MKKLKLWTVSIFAFGLVFNHVACSEQDDSGDTTTATDTSSAEEKQVNLLMVAPLTGTAASTGEAMRNGSKLRWSENNFMIGDYKINLVEVDSESDALGIDSASPDIGAKYRAAVEEHQPVAGFLNWHSGIALELMDIDAEYNLPHLFGLGASGLVNDKYHSDPKYKVWGGKGWPQPAAYILSYFDALQCSLSESCTELTREGGVWNPSTQYVMVATESGAWGESFETGAIGVLEAQDGYWKKNGWTVALKMKVDADMDASTLTAKVKEAETANVSLVVMSSTADNANQFLNLLRAKLPNVVIITEGLGWGGNPGTTAARVLDGGWGPYNPDPAVAQKLSDFKSNYELEYGTKPPVASAGFSYDYTSFTIAVLERALAKHGELTRASILDISTTEVQSGLLTLKDGVVMPEYQYTSESVPDPEYSLSKYYFPVLQYQLNDAGEIEAKTIYPKSMADASYQTPGN
ncbi:MAG: ABC transporter substrate-binding protein [Myxococcota bacterium]|nr:ABC transporter substrate-binding protein [Myxococcota bacterium]